MQDHAAARNAVETALGGEVYAEVVYKVGCPGWKRAKRVGGKRKGLHLNCGASSVVMRDCV